MKIILYIGLFCFALSSCSMDEDTPVVPIDDANPADSIAVPVDKSQLVDIKNKIFTEYYDLEKKKIKFQGPQDEAGKRHGKWLHFSETGIELTMTMYEHGIKHGHFINKYKDGSIFYTGEFQNNKPVGIWKTYSPEGVLYPLKDYGYPED
jgi:hypothetical protein